MVQILALGLFCGLLSPVTVRANKDKCFANTQCKGLGGSDGNCCPTDDGVMLDCCLGMPAEGATPASFAEGATPASFAVPPSMQQPHVLPSVGATQATFAMPPSMQQPNALPAFQPLRPPTYFMHQSSGRAGTAAVAMQAPVPSAITMQPPVPLPVMEPSAVDQSETPQEGSETPQMGSLATYYQYNGKNYGSMNDVYLAVQRETGMPSARAVAFEPTEAGDTTTVEDGSELLSN